MFEAIASMFWEGLLVPFVSFIFRTLVRVIFNPTVSFTLQLGDQGVGVMLVYTQRIGPNGLHVNFWVY
jgi:hypothetical protein